MADRGAVSRRALAISAGFAVLFTVAVLLGRLTVMDAPNLSLVWPAAGVAALWFATQRRAGTRPLDYGALSVITFALNIRTGASVPLAVGFVVANVVQVAVFQRTFAAHNPTTWGAGGTEPLTGMRQLTGLLWSAVVATAAGAVLGPTSVWILTGRWSWWAAAVWMTRNTVSIVLVLAVGLRIGYLVTSRAREQGSPGARAELPFLRLGAWRVLELAALITCSVTAYTLIFAVLDGLPVAFPLLALTVWAALRFDTTIVVLHDLTVGVVAVLFTLNGNGPFAAVAQDATRALVVEAFVGLVAVVGLALALGRDERELLLGQVMRQVSATAEHAARVEVLARASRELFTAADARQAVCRAACEVTGAHAAYLLEPDGLGSMVSTGVVGPDLPPLTVDLSQGGSLTAGVFGSGEPVFVADVGTHPAASARLREALDVASAAWQPVLTDAEDPVGLLVMIWREQVAELPPHVPAMLQTLAAEAAGAIERADLLTKLAHAAHRDPLTGVANRRRWDDAAGGEIARARRTGVPLTFALIDLDHFKRYNDSRGHLAGDELLRAFAVATRGCLREIDVLARWGGEEFALALPGCTADEAVRVADRIRSVVPDGQTCTVGLAQWEPGMSVADVVAAADAALYLGKQGGRDTTVRSRPPTREPMQPASSRS